MPDFPMTAEPRLTRHLVGKGTFRQRPFVVVDAGALGGYEGHWDHFQDQVRIVAFEPGADDTKGRSGAARVHTIACALGRENGTGTLKTYRHPAANSLYTANPDYWNRRTAGEMYEGLSERPVTIRRLDDVLSEASIAEVDFIKLDVEGSELDVLSGAPNVLRSNATIGITFEFLLSRQAYLPSPRPFGTFFDIHQLVEQAGFELYDLSTYRFARTALPQPFAYHYVHSSGELFAGPTIRGQKTNGDAIYFRDLAAPEAAAGHPDAIQVLKAACLLELYGLNDCAAELIQVHRDRLDGLASAGDLLDLLVTPIDDATPSYAEYLDAYRADKRRFMPSPGFRYPDHTVRAFDGTFTPRRRHVSRTSVRPAIELTQDFAANGWRPGTAETVVTARHDRVRIDSDRSQFSYQLVSRPFAVLPGADYLLAYDIDILSGGATVGVIDGEAHSWMTQATLSPGRNAGDVHFVARSKLAEVVIANCGVEEKIVSAIEVASLRVSEAERAQEPA